MIEIRLACDTTFRRFSLDSRKKRKNPKKGHFSLIATTFQNETRKLPSFSYSYSAAGGTRTRTRRSHPIEYEYEYEYRFTEYEYDFEEFDGGDQREKSEKRSILHRSQVYSRMKYECGAEGKMPV